ncbi:MAG: PIN domain-containing protein [Ruminococcus sp.]|nr:PIN domain-containing protein [Ruminococcus sp.]
MKVLIDTNIILDFLTQRQPYYESAERIFKMCSEKTLDGCIAAHSIMNSFYILRKTYSALERREMLKNICEITSVIGIDRSKLIRAMDNIEFKDMEDCLQTECAVSYDAEYIVTRNVKDFTNSAIKALTPDELLEKII